MSLLDVISEKVDEINRDYNEKYPNVKIIPPLTIYDHIFGKSNNYSRLNHVSMLYLEEVYFRFQEVFWKKEMLSTTDDYIMAPISISYTNEGKTNVDDISISLNNPEIKKHFSIPIALYDENQCRFMYLNNGLKNRIFESFLKESQFYKCDGFERIDIKTANTLAILHRVAFYDTKLSISKSNGTNNLIKFNLEREDGSYLSLYTLVDYGIQDPEYTEYFSLDLSMYRMLHTTITKDLAGEDKENRIIN